MKIRSSIGYIIGIGKYILDNPLVRIYELREGIEKTKINPIDPLSKANPVRDPTGERGSRFDRSF